MFKQQPSTIQIGMILFANCSELEFVAPYGIFSHLPNAQIYRLAPSLEPIHSDSGFPLIPNTLFETAPELDVLFVPGGLGVTAKLEDTELLQFLRKQGDRARYVSAIGSGSLLLAAAGLLDGYRATTDWFSLELLEAFGVEPVAEQIVVDNNRITGSSQADGLALGTVITTLLFDVTTAQEAQLRLDYNPTQFTNGFPEAIPPQRFACIRAEQQTLAKARLQVIRRSTAISKY
jgi:cyclohexyl-isocyanide hydratase